MNYGIKNGNISIVPTNIPLTDGVVAILSKLNKQPISRNINE